MTPPPTSTLGATASGSADAGFGLALAALAVIGLASLGATLRLATRRARR